MEEEDIKASIGMQSQITHRLKEFEIDLEKTTNVYIEYDTRYKSDFYISITYNNQDIPFLEASDILVLKNFEEKYENTAFFIINIEYKTRYFPKNDNVTEVCLSVGTVEEGSIFDYARRLRNPNVSSEKLLEDISNTDEWLRHEVLEWVSMYRSEVVHEDILPGLLLLPKFL